MNNGNKEKVPVPTEAELTASGPVAHSPEEAEEMLRENRAKAKKTKAKTEGGASALKAVGQAACKRHGLGQVWVTSDGQVFAQEGDATAHGRNLTDKTIIKVTAK